MPDQSPDPARLVSLIAEAQAEAKRLGPTGVAALRHLDQAAAEANAVQARGGRPDEGLPIGELTTGNDK